MRKRVVNLGALAILVCGLAGNHVSATAGSVDQPQVLVVAVPQYPALAMHGFLGDSITVSVRIVPEGRVLDARVFGGRQGVFGERDDAGFRVECLKAALQWEFTEATGTDTLRRAVLGFRFRMFPDSVEADALHPEFRPPYSVEVRATSQKRASGRPATGGSPLIRQLPAWPVNYTLGPGKALLVLRRIFLEGESVAFDYDSTLGALVINQIPVLQLFALPHGEMPTPKTRWLSSLISAIKSDTAGTPDLSVSRALEKVGNQYLDQSFRVVARTCTVELKFLGNSDPLEIFVFPESPAAWWQMEPEESARLEAARMIWHLDMSPAVFEFKKRDCGGGSSGEPALQVIELARTARQRDLTEPELEQAGHLFLQRGDIECIRAASSGKDE